MALVTRSLHRNLDDPSGSLRGARTLTEAHRRLMSRYASPLLLGPEPSETLLELMGHLFTEEEAQAAQHLPPLIPRTAASVARRSGLPLPQAEALLEGLAQRKRVILAFGSPRRYALLPLVPGTFELALMQPHPALHTPWHRTFAALFESLWDEGYIRHYLRSARPWVRYLPADAALPLLPRACPADRLEEILEEYGDFALGDCQCRAAMNLAGRGCGRPLENCVAMGSTARILVARGLMRPVDRREVLARKRDAEAAGCVTWIARGTGASPGTSSCSCCGCCCHALRTVTQFSAPGFLSRPRYLPHRDPRTCTGCGACLRACPLGAWSGSEPVFDPVRCVGCGLCAVACPTGALGMADAPSPTPLRLGWAEALLRGLPAHVANVARVWARRHRRNPDTPTRGGLPR